MVVGTHNGTIAVERVTTVKRTSAAAELRVRIDRTRRAHWRRILACLEAKTIYRELKDPKQFVWAEGNQIDFYEQIFGWMKTIGGLRTLRHCGSELVDWIVTFTAAAYNLVRLRTLLTRPA